MNPLVLLALVGGGLVVAAAAGGGGKAPQRTPTPRPPRPPEPEPQEGALPDPKAPSDPDRGRYYMPYRGVRKDWGEKTRHSFPILTLSPNANGQLVATVFENLTVGYDAVLLRCAVTTFRIDVKDGRVTGFRSVSAEGACPSGSIFFLNKIASRTITWTMNGRQLILEWNAVGRDAYSASEEDNAPWYSPETPNFAGFTLDVIWRFE